MDVLSKLKYGIQVGKKDLKQLQVHFTEVLSARFSFMVSFYFILFHFIQS